MSAAGSHRVAAGHWRGVLARWCRPLCLRWPWRAGRKALVRWLTPTAEQLPLGSAATMRPGFQLRIGRDPLFRRIWLFGDFEPAETACFARILGPGDDVIDVGANFGWHTLGFAQAVGPSGHVLAVEPIAATAALLRDHLALNRFSERVTVRQVALGAAAGATTVYTYERGSLAEASAADAGRDDARAHWCPLTTLDAVRAALQRPMPTLLKVDVEGFELEVLQGAPKLLAPPDAPIVAFEVSPGFLRRRGLAPNVIHTLLQEHGYTRFWRFGRRTGLQPVEGPEWGLDGALHNFLAAKPARVDRLAPLTD